MKDLIEMLKSAPESQLDASVKPLIVAWSDPPKPIEILEVLDSCVHASLASAFVVGLLDLIYKDACQREGLSHDDVVKQATWRGEQ